MNHPSAPDESPDPSHIAGGGAHTGWFPVGAADDAPARHVHQAKLLGRELAVWRADDNYVNVWENRCLHRGVRLSVGLNEGMELTCMYHGWRYANRTGGCTYIPAHPADAPARTICNKTYPVAEALGLIWTSIDGRSPFEPAADWPTDHDLLTLRSLPFAASPEITARHLLRYRFVPSAGLGLEQTQPAQETSAEAVDATRIDIRAQSNGIQERVILLIQPSDSHECVVHAVLARHPDAVNSGQDLAIWRHHAQALERVRTAAEAEAASGPVPKPLVPALELIEPADPVAASGRTHRRELRVVVARKWQTAADVAAFELAPLDEDTGLPTTQPGAHVDVHLPNGLIRQYSLTNRAGSQDRYVIGVKREEDSAGGSACLHDTVREGDVLAISAPRTNFQLRRSAVSTTLVAGGIGLTPLLAMAETLADSAQPFTLHVFARGPEHVAFADRLAALEHSSGRVVRHLGLDPAATGEQLRTIVSEPGEASHLYLCGPAPFLERGRAEAATAGWPDDAVHFEYFANPTEIDDGNAFRVSLARSAMTLDVGPGETILSVLEQHGVAVPSSCRQGACGTCVVGLVRGRAVHNDVCLRPSERDAGDRIVTCVSRAADDELVLDI